ncbi:MAG: Fe-S cluster assembly protein SufB, partial [Bacteroidales bacterium]|nr:Fe-S cluster assembly protein SufB [Bacteroidales bacterium]
MINSTMIDDQRDIIDEVTEAEYKYGFTSDIDTDVIPSGLSEDVVRLISATKEEPGWMLDFRLEAYRRWLQVEPPS